jgi:hypothetical protein
LMDSGLGGVGGFPPLPTQIFETGLRFCCSVTNKIFFPLSLPSFHQKT